MSMQIIESLETEARGLYTGSIGYLNPCSGGLGFEGAFNVVIRTLSLKPVSDGIVSGIGGTDSNAQARTAGQGGKRRIRLKPIRRIGACTVSVPASSSTATPPPNIANAAGKPDSSTNCAPISAF